MEETTWKGVDGEELQTQNKFETLAEDRDEFNSKDNAINEIDGNKLNSYDNINGNREKGTSTYAKIKWKRDQGKTFKL